MIYLYIKDNAYIQIDLNIIIYNYFSENFSAMLIKKKTKS